MHHDAAAAGIMGVFLCLVCCAGFAFYAYQAICLQTIARKTDTPDGWMAWIPILNLYLACQIGRKPGWWTVLFFVPVANIIISVLVWMNIATQRGKPEWWGILIIVPFVNLVVPAYLAFSE